MSATTAPAPDLAGTAPRGALLARLISFFSGTAGVVAKIVLLSLSNAVAVWAIYVLLTRHHWAAVAVLVAATALVDLVYVSSRRASLPGKFLIPGLVLLLGLQVVPIIYTVRVATRCSRRKVSISSGVSSRGSALMPGA
jgi:hypothetical protein